MTGIKDALRTVADKVVVSADNTEQKTENAGSAFLDRVGDKVLGPTAESQTNNATPIAPDATITPSTQGRRSRHPDGQDPFHSDAPAPADKS